MLVAYNHRSTMRTRLNKPTTKKCLYGFKAASLLAFIKPGPTTDITQCVLLPQ